MTTYENHRSRHMSARDIQNEIELIRRLSVGRELNHPRSSPLAPWVAIGVILGVVTGICSFLL